MTQIYPMSPKALMGLYMQQMMLQAQLIDAQRQIIELQNQLTEKTPPTPSDEDVFWHKASGGIMSHEAATSTDYDTAKKFLDWNYSFAEKHIKPYVNPKVYTEVLNQMTRGLTEHVSSLQTKKEMEDKPSQKKDGKGEVIQLSLALARDA